MVTSLGGPWVREHTPHLIVLPERTGEAAEESPGPTATRWADLVASGTGHRAGLAGEIERRVGSLKPDDPATHIYTSGTTGLSKGVTLTHHNLLWDAQAMVRTGAFDRDYRTISSLPLAHVAERLWSIYFPLVVGGHLYCLPDTKDLLDALTWHRPSTFLAVPRVWEDQRLVAHQIDRSDTVFAPRSLPCMDMPNGWPVRRSVPGTSDRELTEKGRNTLRGRRKS